MTHPLIFEQAGSAHQLSYLLALPPDHGPDTPLIVSVHGVTRQPIEHLAAFVPLADRIGAALMVPVFDERRHRRYQQLRHPRSGRRSDLALLRAVEQVKQQHGLCTKHLHLFGYSGGGQFVHRFALVHPQRVAAVAIGAAGWYTLPDIAFPYPMGMGGMAEAFGQAPDLAAFLRLPMCVWVGEHDVVPDHHLYSTPVLTALQGSTRMERATRWVDAMSAQAALHGVRPTLRMEKVPDAGHDFVDCAQQGGLAHKVFDFFFGPGRVDAVHATTAAPGAPQRGAVN